MDCANSPACSSKTKTSIFNVENSELVEIKEPSNILTAAHGDCNNKLTDKEYNEYPVFKYKAFTFHPIASLIKEKVKSMDYIKTVGLCSKQSSDDLYLEDIPLPGQANDKIPAKICLRFDCTDAVPKIGANIEVFGCVQYETSSGNPVFQVWFFRTCYGNMVGYIETLLQIRQMLNEI